MPDEILLDQADALIRRYRSFVAKTPPIAPVTFEPTPELSLHDDTAVPVLTEVITANAARTQNPDEVLDALKKELANEIAILQTRLLELIDATRQKL